VDKLKSVFGKYDCTNFQYTYPHVNRKHMSLKPKGIKT